MLTLEYKLAHRMAGVGVLHQGLGQELEQAHEHQSFLQPACPDPAAARTWLATNASKADIKGP